MFAPLTYGRGSLLNTNADTIAQEVAKAMAKHMAVQLVYCFEKKGVLMDAEDDESAINNITAQDMEELKEKGIISGGMIPKLDNALEAVAQGVQKVVIGHADELAGLISGQSGTSIT